MNKNTVYVWCAVASIGVTLRLPGAAQPIVEATSGNIFLRSQTGKATQLTASGRDSTPVLSPDRRWIVFVRAVPGKKISTGLDSIDAAEL